MGIKPTQCISNPDYSDLIIAISLKNASMPRCLIETCAGGLITISQLVQLTWIITRITYPMDIKSS